MQFTTIFQEKNRNMNDPIWRRNINPKKKKIINTKSNPSNKIKLPRSKKEEPYPWLFAENSLEELDTRASFVEYLRWMRSPDEGNKDGTKLEIIQRAVTNADYSKQLKKANKRIKLIAGNAKIGDENSVFEVSCPWRIRVGGNKGPESILLPAFDALGIPYIPSSTLRGVARNQAIRDLMKKDQDLTWKEAEEQVAPLFGSLNTKKKSDRMGKVIFLDAYPFFDDSNTNTTDKDRDKGWLAMDMVNNIWKWEQGDKQPTYKPNPNLFISLQQPTFLIGLKKGINCSDEDFKKIKDYLITGLQAGVGSQINSGYGQLSLSNSSQSDKPIFQVKFTLKGQLIHGVKKYSDLHKPYKLNQEAELRPIAFKSMLRYWFRAFALGQLPSDRVKHLEAMIFGGIEPKARGWLKVQIINPEYISKKPENSENGYGKMKGELLLFSSTEIAEEQKENFTLLIRYLTWMMFHLGGVGQGARRPCYYRKKDKLPWRGSTLIPERTKEFWQLPDDIEEFKNKCLDYIEIFYNTLDTLNNFYSQVNHKDNHKDRISLSFQEVNPTDETNWFDAVDSNCRIVVCSGNKVDKKVYPLSVLHKDEFKKDENVCGSINKRSVVWIADLGKYQVVTIFGVDYNPRKKYLKSLKDQSSDIKSIIGNIDRL
jgi:CRISPR-associated protein Cmr6